MKLRTAGWAGIVLAGILLVASGVMVLVTIWLPNGSTHDNLGDTAALTFVVSFTIAICAAIAMDSSKP